MEDIRDGIFEGKLDEAERNGVEIFLYTFLLYLLFFSSVYKLDEDFHDFYYQADLVIDIEPSLLGRTGDLFTCSEIEEEIVYFHTFSE